jgi:hypothetical protein
MSTDGSTDDAMAVPPAKPLTGEPADPDQPDPSEVMPGGEATEVEHLVPPEEQDPAQS